MATMIYVRYTKHDVIPEKSWNSWMDYKEYKEVHDVLTEFDEGFNAIIFHTIIKKGFDWALNLTEDDIEQARKQQEDEMEKEKKSGVFTVVANGASMVNQMAAIKRIADILKTPEDLLGYIMLSGEFKPVV